MAATRVFVETLNATDANAGRTRLARSRPSRSPPAWFFGGWYYVVYYHIDEEALIMSGPVPWAHSFFMESEEHLFFISLILAFYLPFVDPHASGGQRGTARAMVMVVAARHRTQRTGDRGCGRDHQLGCQDDAGRYGRAARRPR